MDVILNQYTRQGGKHDLDSAQDSASTLIILFGASDQSLIEPALQDLQRVYPESNTIGCSSAGEIYQQVICDDSLSIALINFEHTRIDRGMQQVQGYLLNRPLRVEQCEQLMREEMVAGQQIHSR